MKQPILNNSNLYFEGGYINKIDSYTLYQPLAFSSDFGG